MFYIAFLHLMFLSDLTYIILGFRATVEYCHPGKAWLLQQLGVFPVFKTYFLMNVQ